MLMRILLCGLLMIGAVQAALLAPAVSPALSMDIKILEWKFDKDAVGTVPEGFAPSELNRSAGRWEVASDPRAPSPPNILARQATDQANKDQIIYIDGLEAGSLDLTVRLNVGADGAEEGGGVLFRGENDRTYYVVWLSPHEKLLRLDKVVNGQVTHVQDLTVDSADAGKWHTLRLLIHGPVMEAIFNNRQFLSGREETWAFGTYKKGKVGLWAKGAAPVYFDTVRYIDMDGSTTSSGPFGMQPAPAPR
jgi:hypothetical protein